jgi:outer membrane biogenesis lipoprotein LolB
MRQTPLLLVTACLLISGCSEDKQSYAEMSDDNVFKGQVDALEKAKTVESTIQSSFDQRMQEK